MERSCKTCKHFTENGSTRGWIFKRPANRCTGAPDPVNGGRRELLGLSVNFLRHESYYTCGFSAPLELCGPSGKWWEQK